jgi:hypothetical protein
MPFPPAINQVTSARSDLRHDISFTAKQLLSTRTPSKYHAYIMHREGSAPQSWRSGMFPLLFHLRKNIRLHALPAVHIVILSFYGRQKVELWTETADFCIVSTMTLMISPQIQLEDVPAPRVVQHQPQQHAHSSSMLSGEEVPGRESGETKLVCRDVPSRHRTSLAASTGLTKHMPARPHSRHASHPYKRPQSALNGSIVRVPREHRQVRFAQI